MARARKKYWGDDVSLESQAEVVDAAQTPFFLTETMNSINEDMAGTGLTTDSRDQDVLVAIQDLVRAQQHRAAMAVNSRLLYAYWGVGQFIPKEQKQQGWGANVIEQLSKDLRSTFPEFKEFSSRILNYMRSFAEEWPGSLVVQSHNSSTDLDKSVESEFMQQSVAQAQKPDPIPIVQQTVAQLELSFEELEAQLSVESSKRT